MKRIFEPQPVLSASQHPAQPRANQQNGFRRKDPPYRSPKFPQVVGIDVGVALCDDRVEFAGCRIGSHLAIPSVVGMLQVGLQLGTLGRREFLNGNLDFFERAHA